MVDTKLPALIIDRVKTCVKNCDDYHPIENKKAPILRRWKMGAIVYLIEFGVGCIRTS